MRRHLLALAWAVGIPLLWWLVTLGLDLPVAPAIGVGVALALWILRGDLRQALRSSPEGAAFVAAQARPFVRPLAALGAALGPLLVTPIALLVLISRGAPAPVQALVGAAAVVVVLLVVREARQHRRAVVVLLVAARLLRPLRVALPAVGVVLPVVVAVSWIWLVPALDRLKDRGGWAAVAFGAAVVLWAGGLVLRLLGHARRPLRMPVVAVLLAVILGLLSGAGVLPARDPAQPFGLGWRTWAWLTLGIVLGSALLEGTFIRLLGTAAGRGWRKPLALAVRRIRFHRVVLLTRTASRLGMGVAVLSALLTLAAAVIGQREVKAASRPVQSSHAKPQAPSVDFAHLADEPLAELFAPILAFRADERWPPSSVDDFLLHAVLQLPRGSQRRTLDSLPRSCRTGPSDRACHTLTCDPPGSCRPGALHERGHFVDATVYAHVIRFTPATASLFAVANPYSDRLRLLVQYWIFYPYDLWDASVVIGRLQQEHEGDWESVTVGLGAKAPLFVAYSQHCAGRWADWSNIEAETAASGPADWEVGRRLDPGRAIHPLIAVARGSHANYPRTAERRASDWASCRDIPEAAVAAISYASNIRDLTGDAWRVYPRKVAVVTERDPPMSFPGHWGISDVTTLKSASTRTLNAGLGPTTPPLKALWKDPVLTIFHRAHWREAK